MHWLKAQAGTHIIGGKTIHTDSHTEARILWQLENNGFHGKWDRLPAGYSYNGHNYTPDVELSVQLDSMTYRAWVELKPVGPHQFTLEARQRMCAASYHYPAIILLLYVEGLNAWYCIDRKTCAVTSCAAPEPGAIDIDKLWQPMITAGKQIYHHRYIKKFNPWLAVASGLLTVIEAVMDTTPKKRARRRSY